MSNTAVVVGAGRGIGQAIGEDLARACPGDRLILADIDAALVERVAASLQAQGVEAIARHVDITDEKSVQELVDETSDADRVAIAAGVFDSSPSLEVTVADFERILRVNTIGCFDVARRYAAGMAARGGGSIVAVASVAARMPRMRQAVYSASKAALRQSLRVLAMEVAGSGVRVNTVSPGPTDTEMMRQLASDHATVDDLADGSLLAFRPRIPAGRVARGSDVAAAVRFLLSPESSHILLGDIVVDGGELLGM
ncbi:SDR family NAD(P)-dependent oxidoreductase [Dactylosporangium sucinum]|uniref:2,3-dihydro-2,3-dihydroxybenzoate dehydrogenase n=1 Tax=Dactylosporangium sucinum TaxID=1424081 RepID=A0A917TJL6_9ACTN|nr:SDR family oxidoreductase [Dactylosporangium sucinum]GGM25905.1 2,3-dihydro-2,3-dihydroxybenzoate dehydrogenase [Dactylosporangium sucinum]